MQVRSSRMWFILANLALAALYFGFGKLAILQAVPPGIATLIFFPSGIALAAIVRYGFPLLPGVAIGALLLNQQTGMADLALAMGATMQAAVAARLFARFSDPALASARAILAYLLVVPLACLVSSTTSVTALLWSGQLAPGSVPVTWIMWWAGDTIGMLIAAPLCWIAIGQPRTLWRRRLWQVGMPLCLLASAFILIYDKVATLEYQQRQHAFTLQAQQLADVFQYQFSEHDRLMYAMGSLYRPTLSNGEDDAQGAATFARAARSYLDTRAELSLISYAPRVTAPVRARFEQWAQDSIASGFTVRQLQADGKLATAAARAQYYPTAYIEPLAGNEAVLGMDLLSEPLRAAMVRDAIASRRAAASAPVRLVQQNGRAAILLAQAVGTDGAGPGAQPAGILVAVVDVARTIALVQAQPDFVALSVRLQDVTYPSQPQLLADYGQAPAASPQVHKALSMGGRQYLLTVAPTALAAAATAGWQSWGALGTGMILTGLLGAFLLLVSGQREQIESLVAARTSQLAEREARLQAILDQAADAIVTVDGAGTIESVNGAAERLFGYPGATLSGRPFYQLVPAAQLPVGPLRAEAGGEPFGVRSDGSHFPVALAASAVAMPGSAATPALAVCIVRDLSEQRRAQHQILALEALKQTQSEMRTAEKMAALGSLVAGVAHELNTPVGNSLLAATALAGQVAVFEQQLASGGVRRSTLDAHLADAAQGCALITASLERVADLIASFKQVAIDQTIDQRSEFALAGVCEAALAGKAQALRAASCSYSADVPPGLRLRSYPASIGQVLNSLVNNALLHGFGGRANGVITVTARAADEGWIELVFADDGVGMAPEVLQRVFDPFFTTKLGQGSSGLGMNIVYNLVTGMLGGRIAIESDLGMGTRVVLTLPIDAPARSGNTRAEARAMV